MGAREELFEKLMMVLIGEGVNTETIRNGFRIALAGYEITDRCTEVAMLKEDRNEYLIKKFIMAKTVAGRTPKTIRFYATSLAKIIPAIGKTVDDITADDIRFYLAIRQRRDGVSKATIGNELRVLRTFFEYLAVEELIPINPTKKIDAVKIEKRDEVAFTDLEVEQIRAATKNNRERAIVDMLLSTGCRASELVQMQIAELEEDKIMVHGKGEKDRMVYINARARISLEQYLAERSDNNPYLFPAGIKTRESIRLYTSVKGEWYKHPELVGEGGVNISSIETNIRRIGKRAGVENVHPHRFRRTCATHALRRGMPIEKVSKMLGHEQLDTTKIYINVDEDELAQAHKKFVV